MKVVYCRRRPRWWKTTHGTLVLLKVPPPRWFFPSLEVNRNCSTAEDHLNAPSDDSFGAGEYGDFLTPTVVAMAEEKNRQPISLPFTKFKGQLKLHLGR